MAHFLVMYGEHVRYSGGKLIQFEKDAARYTFGFYISSDMSFIKLPKALKNMSNKAKEKAYQELKAAHAKKFEGRS